MSSSRSHLTWLAKPGMKFSPKASGGAAEPKAILRSCTEFSLEIHQNLLDLILVDPADSDPILQAAPNCVGQRVIHGDLHAGVFSFRSYRIGPSAFDAIRRLKLQLTPRIERRHPCAARYYDPEKLEFELPCLADAGLGRLDIPNANEPGHNERGVLTMR